MKKLALLIAIMLIPLASAEPLLQISTKQSPMPVIAGNDGIIKLYITNIGTSYIERVKVQLLHIDTPLISKTDFSDNQGSLTSGNSMVVDYKFSSLSTTPTGFYLVQFKVSGCKDSTCKDYIVQSNIQIESPNAVDIEITPDILPLHFNRTIYLIITNGNSDVKNLQIQIINPVIQPIGNSNYISIEELKPNETKKIPLQLATIPGTTPGVYPFYIYGSYTDAIGLTHQINITAAVKLKGDIDLILSKESQTQMFKGKKGYVSIKISNAGTSKANFLTLNISSKEFDIEPRTIYIGDLDSDDYDSEKIALTPLVGEGKYNLPVKLMYDDIYGNKYEKTFYISVEIEKKPQVTNMTIVYAIASLIALVVAYTLIRKGRR